MAEKVNYGLNKQGNLTACKAKAGNVGKGRCTHTAHFDTATKEQAIKEAELFNEKMVAAEARVKAVETAADKKNRIRWAQNKAQLAENSKDEFELRVLSSERSDYVRERVACNPHTPPEILRKWSTANSYSMQKAVAVNPNAPLDVLEEFSSDENLARFSDELARNSSCPPEILCKVIDKVRPVNRGGDNVLRAIAKNKNVDGKVLEEMYKKSMQWDEDTFNALKMEHDGLGYSPESFRKFWLESRKEVLNRVAQDPNTPGGVLEKLIEDDDNDLVEMVKNNPSTPMKALLSHAEKNSKE